LPLRKTIVLNSDLKSASPRRCHRLFLACGVLSCILLLTAGSLVLSSCATTQKGLDREEKIYLTTSNGLVTLKSAVPYVPPPYNGLLEGVLAIGGALMAVWASHLHRSMRDLQDGVKNGAAAPTAGPAEKGSG
jgi:hypothetical protein